MALSQGRVHRRLRRSPTGPCRPECEGTLGHHDHPPRERLGYDYDRAGRITQVREESEGNRSLKEFAYDSGSTGGAWAKGQLVTAVRHNYALAPVCGESVLHDVHVTESYIYSGLGGAVSGKTTRIASGANAGHTFTQSWSYDDLGNVSQLTYPRCTHAECSGALPGSRVQSFGYDQGWLTTVPGFASGITYHPNGLLASIAHGNGVTYTVENDPFFQARPRSFGTVGGNRNWNSGIYRYDGAGNVAAMGSDYVLYDPASRVKEARVADAFFQGGTERFQRYGYDRYGNLLEVETREGSSAWERRTYATNPATNRLTTAVYDERGNQLSQPGYSYAYDAIGMLNRHVGGGNDAYHVYSADDERVWTLEWDSTGCFATSPQIFSLRDLGGQVLRKFRLVGATWSLDKDYLYRDGQLLASVDGLNQVAHYHPDHLGTPRLITGDPGAASGTAFLLGRHNYFPYGEEATPAAQNTLEMRFTGHERDLHQSGSADDLDYMHARHYRPLAGRFLSPDPVIGEPHRPQSWNRFAYVRGNPVNFTDPTGEFAVGAAATTFINVCYLQGLCSNDRITVVDAGSSNTYLTGLQGLATLRAGGYGHFFLSSLQELPINIGGRFSQAYTRHKEQRQAQTEALDRLFPHGSYEAGIEAGDCKIAIMPGGPGGWRLRTFGGKKARDLITGGGKRSDSYSTELAERTYAEIVKLSKGKGPVASAARGMKKLIEQSPRLTRKSKNAQRGRGRG